MSQKPVAVDPASTSQPDLADNNLQDLARAVAVQQHPADSRGGPESARAPGPHFNPIGLLIAAGLLFALGAAGMIVYILVRGGDSAGTPQIQSGTTRQTQVISEAPNIAGIPLKGESIILLLDRGGGTAEVFDLVKSVAGRALHTLSPRVRFQVIFWETDSIVEIPRGKLVFATGQTIADCLKGMSEVSAFGQSHIEHPLELALSRDPDDIVMVTAKATLDEEFAGAVQSRGKGHRARIHLLLVGSENPVDAVRNFASQTGGEFRQLTAETLRQLAQ